ncbi:MAG: hypothetical protein R3D62_06430 [Xanthobacteraceae bacterium]
MMMFAGAAATALDFLTGLAMDAAKSAVQKSAASASSSAASTFSLTTASSTAAKEANSATAASSGLSSDTLQTLLALQQDYKQTSATDLLSLLDGDKDGKSTPRNAVLQETQRRLQQAQNLATAAPGQALIMNI